MATNEVYESTTPTGRTAATGGLTKGRVVGIDASGNIAYAQTDATAVVAIGVAADTYSAGEYVSIFKPGSLAYVYVKPDSSIGDEMTASVAADSGAAIEAAGEGNHKIVAVTYEDTGATSSTLCRIVFYDKYIPGA
jgi:hypothetical protein